MCIFLICWAFTDIFTVIYIHFPASASTYFVIQCHLLCHRIILEYLTSVAQSRSLIPLSSDSCIGSSLCSEGYVAKRLRVFTLPSTETFDVWMGMPVSVRPLLASEFNYCSARQILNYSKWIACHMGPETGHSGGIGAVLQAASGNQELYKDTATDCQKFLRMLQLDFNSLYGDMLRSFPDSLNGKNHQADHGHFWLGKC